MNYTKVKIFTEDNNLEMLALTLQEKGITGMEIQERSVYSEFLNKRNSYDWDYVDPELELLRDISAAITFYLEDTPEGIELLDAILEEILPLEVNRIEVGSVSDEDWKDKWKEYFKPVRITDRITVKPTWQPCLEEDGEIVIEMDPGMAFGTGTHPTTSLCIKLLEKYLTEGSKTVLDVGCGSGILTIAAALLGADRVLGVEIDPVAADIARENVLRNRLASSVQIVQGDLTNGVKEKFDILVANLMADLVIMLSKDAPNHLNKNGVFIASGILTDKKEQVMDALQASGFHILDMPEDGEWCALAAAEL